MSHNVRGSRKCGYRSNFVVGKNQRSIDHIRYYEPRALIAFQSHQLDEVVSYKVPEKAPAWAVRDLAAAMTLAHQEESELRRKTIIGNDEYLEVIVREYRRHIAFQEYFKIKKNHRLYDKMRHGRQMDDWVDSYINSHNISLAPLSRMLMDIKGLEFTKGVLEGLAAFRHIN